MLLSRFWYALLAITLGASVFILFVAVQTYSRAGARATSEALSADSSAVDWYLHDDARKRSSALIAFTLSPEIGSGLAKASGDAKIDAETRRKTTDALRKLALEVPAELKFDALWAVDASGRVVANAGFSHRGDEWELGGFASVADALHGWIRDDAWVWNGRIYRVVMRPIEKEAGAEPVGAIVGAKVVDDTFAYAVTKRTGAAVGFYADGARVASGAPEGFDKGSLDEITRDLKLLDRDKDYQEKGRSDVRVLSDHLGVVYARLPGEAWDLGAGYAVGRVATLVKSPLDFLGLADNSDKEKLPTKMLVALSLLLAGIGVVFTFLEHNRPLAAFRREVLRLAKGEIDALQPSKFRGQYRQLAADINDGIDKVAAKGGTSRKAADLAQVLGPLPAQPQMSAFSVPRTSAIEPPPSEGRSSPPKVVALPRSASRPMASPPSASRELEASPGPSPAPAKQPPPPPKRPAPAVVVASPPAPPVVPAAPPADAPRAPPPAPPPPPPPPPEQEEPAPVSAMLESDDEFDELADWRNVYSEFIALKKQCGETTAQLTFEKFKGTLQRNKDALVARHNCARVRFTVYVKEGKAALKASPVK